MLVTREILAALVGLAVTSAALPLLLQILRRRQIMDIPNDRSSHLNPTPRGAGAAQMIGLVAAWSALAWFPFWGVVSAVGFGLLGFVDDLKSQRPSLRLSIQFVLGVFTAAVLLGERATSAASFLLVFCVGLLVVLVVNATNFMDGINGMSALHGIILGLAYWIILWQQDSEWAPIAAALVGLSVAFLPWNWGSRARIFLGDSGSYLLGALLSTFAIAAFSSGANPMVAVGPLTIYLVDVLRTLLVRLRRGQSLLVPHRDHVYQELVSTGLSHSQVTLIVAGSTAAVVAVALANSAGNISPALAAVMLLMVALFYLSLPRILNLGGRATQGQC